MGLLPNKKIVNSIEGLPVVEFRLGHRNFPHTSPSGKYFKDYRKNILNTKWEQATFFFESRLRNEAAGVNDIHFVPGNPRFFMGGLAWYF